MDGAGSSEQIEGRVKQIRAMTEPLRQIVANAGEESSVILDKVRRGKGKTVTTPPRASTPT